MIAKAPPPDGPLAVEPSGIPEELRHQRAWAAWRYEMDAHWHWSKPPYNPTTRQRADPKDAGAWSTFDDALEAYRERRSPDDGGRPYDGISFAIDPQWGIVGVDLDHVSLYASQAERIVRELDSYTERSPGGDGLRVFVKGCLPYGRRKRDWVEMYIRQRFLTVTGQHLDGTPTAIQTQPRGLEVVFWTWLGQDEASIKRSMR